MLRAPASDGEVLAVPGFEAVPALVEANRRRLSGDRVSIDGMSLEDNRADLERHAADFEARRGFTFTVLEPDRAEVIGCVYLYPSASSEHDRNS